MKAAARKSVFKPIIRSQKHKHRSAEGNEIDKENTNMQ
jgi:hypothetical protein